VYKVRTILRSAAIQTCIKVQCYFTPLCLQSKTKCVSALSLAVVCVFQSQCMNLQPWSSIQQLPMKKRTAQKKRTATMKIEIRVIVYFCDYFWILSLNILQYFGVLDSWLFNRKILWIKFFCIMMLNCTEAYCIHLKKKNCNLFFWINELIFHEKNFFLLCFSELMS